MKNIHEILAAMGIEVPAEKKADLDKELLANYRTLADYEKQANKLRLAEEKVQTTAEALKQFDGVDVNGLKNEIETLKGDLAAKDADYQKALEERDFNDLLDHVIREANGRSAKSIKANLDLDALRQSKNQENDMKAALAALKESDGYLFHSAQPKPAPTIVLPTGGKSPQATDEDRARAVMGLPPQKGKD